MSSLMHLIQNWMNEHRINVYDVALMDKNGIEEWVAQPCNACNNSYSVTKAFTATAIGMLWSEGKLDLDESVTTILRNQAPYAVGSAWDAVTVRHALLHNMGISRGYLDIDVEDSASYGTDDFLRILFDEPLPHAPGTFYQYSDAAYYLLSRIAEERSGEPVDHYLMRRLFYPMHVREAAWSRCPMHHPLGATGLYMRARDIVKLGWLYVNNGAYDVHSLLDPAWIKMEEEHCFAFQPIAATAVRGKGGMYGQMLLISRACKTAIAWHAFTEDSHLNELNEAIARLLQGCAV